GLRVPQDVAVSGFDDIALAASVAPALSTVQQDTKQAGTLLVESLVALIRGEAAQSRTIPVRLALRDSSRSSGLQPPLGWAPSGAETGDALTGRASDGTVRR
ncbi:substrate-binding domain-containing protein, partial [Xanthomonas perforans]